MRAPFARLGACVVTFWLLAVAIGGASWPQSQGGASGAVLVSVDFRALARDGTPIRDLRAGDVTLKVGRRAREIVALQLVDLRASGQRQPAAPPGTPAPPFVTNAAESSGGRDVVIVVDDEGIQASRSKQVSDLLASLLDALSPADRVAWVNTRDPKASVPLTANHGAIRAVIAGLTGHGSTAETETEVLCRTRRNVDALLSVFAGVAPSVPSVVVFLSNGFAPPAAPAMKSMGTITSQPAGGPCEIQPRDLDDLTAAAAASRAHVFGIQVIDDTASGAARSGDFTGGFEHVAGLSGNAVMRLAGNQLPAVKRIASETAAYYVAAFEAGPEEQNGSSQRVEIAVTRPDVTVRAWPNVVIPKAGARKSTDGEMKVRDMLSSPRVLRDLALRAAIHISRASADGKQRVVCVFEPASPDTSLSEAGIALFDDKGTPRAQWTGPRNELKRAPVVAPLNAPAPGTYRVRLAARDTSGAAGTLDQSVTIEPPAKGTVTLGALVLGRETSGAFTPVLQFVSEPNALGAVEIYDAPRTAKVTAVFELAASETGRALAVLPGTVQMVRDDLRIASMTFPIKPMPAGEVVVRAVVSVDGKPLDAKPTRTLRKVAQ